MSVSWRPRKNGVIPGNSLISNKEVFGHNPRALIKFYESNLNFVYSNV